MGVLFLVLFCLTLSRESTGEEADKAIEAGGLVVVKYYLETCHFCTKIKEEYKSLENDLASFGDKIQFLDINCKEHKEFCEKGGVHSFPTIIPYYHKLMYEQLLPPREIFNWKLQILEIYNSPLNEKYIGKTKFKV
ncbi:hypothetical protein EIN_167580 [Entamoeba invadens IP1]|uniref:Thioredoxin domain-containing protein n=1 Tax=Entamoeba invadens IP1 TaxID=370355 RepID=A0A0A1U0P4_ENTIV|nr:hypothetical protein EIN_167580 [Entamoeba invadens IP1]ELP84443.1 hypothetical protein EIN_167580 [Entamoeba invadens IP1]|eukprot:XP_004183789.1 hypothetical protein EIN_167580 [Entamoeba invadens IP1]